MAAQFPSNSHNGENYYLPSDVFFSDKIISKFTPHHFLEHPHLQHQLRHHQLSSIDDLAHHFTALSLLQRQTLNPKPNPRIPHNFKHLSPPVNPQILPGYFRVNGNGVRERELELGQRLTDYRTEPLSSSGSKPCYGLRSMKPTPAQIESYLKERANRVLQGKQMQNRLLQQNQNMPISGSGFGFKGGFARESGGTGVFHPHPRINTCNSTIGTAAKKQTMADVRDGQEIPVTHQWKSTKRLPATGTSKQNQLSSDIRLPKEWTY